jgi:transketolase
MAIAEAKLAAEFNTDEHPIIDHRTYVIVGDGCLMEGVGAEAASLAGHLRLGKLIVFYDANKISIEGNTDITFTEDVPARFRAYGWQTLEGDAHDPRELLSLIREAQADSEHPTLIKLHSVVGKSAPTMQGEHSVHGKPLGDEEIRRARRALGVDEDAEFYVDPDAYRYFEERQHDWRRSYDQWQERFTAWAEANPALKEKLDRYLEFGRSWYRDAQLPEYAVGEADATRAVSGKVLNAYADAVPNLIGGSADLAGSNKTEMPQHGDYSADNQLGRTIRFGVREHLMGSLVNGMALHGGYRPFCATLFVFTDYMRPAIRLAALMKLPIIYILTHDSIYLGGDGPTHQPVEHLMALRIIPNLFVLRPGDPEEAVEAWRIAMERLEGPTAMVLSRQKLAVYEKADPSWRQTIRRGAYVVQDTEGTPDVTLVATGSEVGLALEAARIASEYRVRVVSMLSKEAFLAQEQAFQDSIIPPESKTITAEAGVTWGWEVFTQGRRQNTFGLNHFGASGRGDEVAEHFGFTAQALAERIRS